MGYRNTNSSSWGTKTSSGTLEEMSSLQKGLFAADILPVVGGLPTIDIASRRYIGSKTKLIDWIFTLIEKECEGDTFADIFSGTGIVAARAAKSYGHIILNDLLFSNKIMYDGFFSNQVYDEQKVANLALTYNNFSTRALEDNFFSTNFGGKFFDDNSARIIGAIRQDIENRKDKLLPKEYAILLASLLYSSDKIANTVGHYDAYFKKSMASKKFLFRLINPISVGRADIYRKDANLLVKEIKADIAYIDPPYNSRQYSRFYHILETLVKWDNPALYGVALKPEPENMAMKV